MKLKVHLMKIEYNNVKMADNFFSFLQKGGYHSLIKRVTNKSNSIFPTSIISYSMAYK